MGGEGALLDSYIRAGKEPRRRKKTLKGLTLKMKAKTLVPGDGNRREGWRRGKGEGERVTTRGREGRKEELMTGEGGKEWATNGRRRYKTLTSTDLPTHKEAATEMKLWLRD